MRRSGNIRRKQWQHWVRVGTTLEQLACMRLAFAWLKVQLGVPARSLTPAGRPAVCRLLERADVAARLERFSERLETCEGWYDAAVDRSNEYRWFRDESAMEITIIALLLIEVVLMWLDLSKH